MDCRGANHANPYERKFVFVEELQADYLPEWVLQGVYAHFIPVYTPRS